MPSTSARRRAGCGVLAGAVSVLFACGRPAPERRDPARNVLLITIDTLRADAMGAYGNRTVSTPWMDRLAAGGVRFAQARASTVVTLPSHANILSGLNPFRHGVRENAGFRFPAEVDTLASLLHARGYRTAAFVSTFPLDARLATATSDPEPFIELARASLAAGEIGKARETAGEALRKSPGHPWAMAVLGAALVRDGQRAAGVEYLNRAFSAGPRRPMVWHSLAEGFESANDPARAALCRKRAAALASAH